MYKNVSSFNFIIAFAISLFFFPSITFGLLQAEVFPWGIILSTIIIAYHRKINNFFVVVLAMFALNIIVFNIINITDLRLPEVVRSLLAYVNSIISLIAFYQFSEDNILKSAKLVKGIFIFLIVLGLLQIMGALSAIDFFFKFLIPRSSSTSLGFMNRGVTLLSTEPARAGISLVFIYILVRTVFIKEKKRPLYDFGIFLFLVLIIQSFMSLSLFLVYLIVVYRLKLLKLLIAVILLAFLGDYFAFGGRSLDLLDAIGNQNSFEDIVFLLVDNSGHRLISIYTSWLYAITHPFGGGIGYWESSSVSALEFSGIDVSQYRYFIKHGDSNIIPIRSSGYMSNLVLDIGIFGIIIFGGFLYSILKKFWSISKESRNIILIFLFKIMFIGSVGTPVAWIASIIALKYLYNKQQFQDIKHA
ncbi:hypothetical protein BFP78_03265 [Gaetbulibacter sp. 5U11]|nr:hypothetical protein BFP78_03265 [Gaetbulibacter sp. 5U11]